MLGVERTSLRSARALRGTLAALACATAFLVAGCGGSNKSTNDAGTADATMMQDGSVGDAGGGIDAAPGVDAGRRPDAGPRVDAGRRPDAGSGVDAGRRPDAGESCPTGTHVCQCATGYYCLANNADCLSPMAPCPAGV